VSRHRVRGGIVAGQLRERVPHRRFFELIGAREARCIGERTLRVAREQRVARPHDVAVGQQQRDQELARLRIAQIRQRAGGGFEAAGELRILALDAFLGGVAQPARAGVVGRVAERALCQQERELVLAVLQRLLRGAPAAPLLRLEPLLVHRFDLRDQLLRFRGLRVRVDVLLPVRERLALLEADRIVEMLRDRELHHGLRDAHGRQHEGQDRAAHRLGDGVDDAREADAPALGDALLREQQGIVRDLGLELFAQRGVDLAAVQQLGGGAAVGDRIVAGRVHGVLRVGGQAARWLAGRAPQSFRGLQRGELAARRRRVGGECGRCEVVYGPIGVVGQIRGAPLLRLERRLLRDAAASAATSERAEGDREHHDDPRGDAAHSVERGKMAGVRA